MKKILIFTIVFIIISLPSYSQKNILIFGDISNCFTMEGVANANVELLDANGNVVVSDSSKLIVRKDVYENSESYSIDKYSGAIFKLSIKEIQDYKLIINALGYLPYVQHIKADELRSIKNFDAGSIYLHPEPKQQILDEVVVTATKVKMVYKGDTIVYNADAFNVSQSESLRKLIEQMPGTEFIDGRIYVNGKYVDNLLLNGKNFFNGNIAAALDNLPAYIVDKVKVYERSSELSELTGKDMHDNEYVMDVKLKREYVGTWLFQADAGGGTNERYALLSYIMRVDDRQMFTFHSDINNLNMKRKQTEIGRIVDRVSSGDRKYKSASINYYIEPNKAFRFRSNIDVSHTDDEMESWKNAEKFLTPNNLIQRSVNRIIGEETFINAFGAVTLRPLRHQRYEISYNFKYDDIKTFGNNKSVSYFQHENDEWYNMSVDSIFDIESRKEESKLLYTLMNPLKEDECAINHNIGALATYAIDDNVINIKANLIYDIEKNNGTEIYALSYKQDKTQSEKQHRYNSCRDRMTNLDVNAEYIFKYLDTESNNGQITPYLQYKRIEGKESHPEYRLDRIENWLEGMNDLDFIPSHEVLAQCIDNENSYYSWITNNILSFGLKLSHKGKARNNRYYKIALMAEGAYNSHSLDYEKMEYMNNVKKDNFLFSSHTSLEYYPCQNDKSGSTSKWVLDYNGTPTMPEMTWLLPLNNTRDPLNLFIGNPELKNEYTHNIELRYNYNWKKSKRSITWNANWLHTDNDIVNYSIYDKTMGKRIYKPVNTSKTHSVSSQILFSTPLDKDRNIYLATSVRGGYSQYAGFATSEETNMQYEMIRNKFIAPKITLRYTPNSNLRTSLSWSTRYNDISSGGYDDDYYKTDIAAEITWKMPYGFELSSNINVEDYRGYYAKELNKTYPVWDASLSRHFLKNRLSVKIEAHDILAREKGIKTVIDSDGRYDTWNNHLQRYVMLHIGYRINWSEKSKIK